jgi:hypothetical protein
MEARSSPDEDVRRRGEDGTHLAALAAEVVPDPVLEDMRSLGAKDPVVSKSAAWPIFQCL